jgi:hypothetical protein
VPEDERELVYHHVLAETGASGLKYGVAVQHHQEASANANQTEMDFVNERKKGFKNFGSKGGLGRRMTFRNSRISL